MGQTNNMIPLPDISGRKPRVLLLYPTSPNHNISPPLGLAIIAAVFKNSGCEVRALDMAAQLVEDGDERLTKELQNFRPDAVAMSLIVGAARHAYRIIEEILAPLNVPIIAGGPHATLLPEEALARGVNIIARGEGEGTAADLAGWLKGEKKLQDIEGISYLHQDGSIHRNPDRPLIADLDSLPLPDHSLFDPSDYFNSPEEYVRAGKIMSSRGCPNKCTFCANPVFGRKFRFRSADSIIAEMEMLMETYGIDRFEFVDDAFTANRRRIIELSEALRKIPDVTFSCVTRLENLDEETAPMLRAAGLYLAHIGVESANRETLKRIRKNIDLDKLEPTLRLLGKNGILASLFFMFGFPWESADEMRETNRMIERLKPLVHTFNQGGVLSPYPGGEIYEEYRESAGFSNWWLSEWRPEGYKPLHELQPVYFFPYDDEKLGIMVEALDTIFRHNNKTALEIVELKEKLAVAEGNAQWRLGIIGQLEEQVRDRDRQLREIWNKSTVDRLKRAWKKLTRSG